MANELKKSIFQEVVPTRFISIIIDECKYVSNFEQLSICLQYSIGSRPTERFIEVVHLSEGSYAAPDIVKGIKKLVSELVAVGCILTSLNANGELVMSGE